VTGIPAIASKLTKAEERAIARLTREQIDMLTSAVLLVDGRCLINAAHQALPDGMVRYYSSERDALTPFGLSIRAHLIDLQKEASK